MTTNPKDIATEDLTIAKPSVAISSAHHGGGDDDDEDGVCDCDDDIDDIDDDDDDDVGDDDNHKIEYKGGIELNGHRGHWILYRRNTRHFRAQNTIH